MSNRQDHWVTNTTRGILGWGVLTILAFGCVLLWAAYGPWVWLAGMAIILVGWVLLERLLRRQ
jgi:hypothetical protein